MCAHHLVLVLVVAIAAAAVDLGGRQLPTGMHQRAPVGWPAELGFGEFGLLLSPVAAAAVV